MKLLLRIEVLFLLALTSAGIVWVLMDGSGKEAHRAPLKAVQSSQPLGDTEPQLRRCVLERDHGNARLDLDLRVSNTHSRKLLLAPPDLRLVNAKGADVPAFFLPTEPPPELPPQSTSEVKMRFWLEASDLMGPLNLVIEGKSLPVKTAAPLDLQALENTKSTEMPVGSEWVVSKK